MFAQHPRIGRPVVAEEGLFPETGSVLPGRVVVVESRFRVFPERFGNVLYRFSVSVRDEVGMPRPIEHRYEFVFFLVAGFLVFAHLASERIGRRPRVAVDGLRRRAGRP